MRERITYALAVAGMALLTWNLYKICFVLPKEANVAAYQIFYFHVQAALTAFSCFFVALVASGLYISSSDLKYDAFAAGVTEVAVAFASVNLATGMIWARYAWGIWWAWDARLTSMLTCWLMYAGYLILRRAIDEPTQRARLSAFVSILGCVNVAFVYKSIEWFRTQHPAPVLSIRGGGGMAPGMEAPMYWNYVAMLCFATVLIIVRMRQEAVSREIDSLRRMAHAY